LRISPPKLMKKRKNTHDYTIPLTYELPANIKES